MKIRLLTLLGALSCAGGALAEPATDPLSLSVQPSSLIVSGAGATELSVTNSGRLPVTLDASVGDYIVTLDGEVAVDPKLPPGRSAKRWLTVTPSRMSLAPGSNVTLTVTSRPSRVAQPGDHHALVLLTGASSASGPVVVRARVGVMTLVRVGGPLRRRLVFGAMTVRRAGRAELVRFTLANLGNVNERLATGQTVVELRQNGRFVARLRPATRSFLPGTRGVLKVVYRGSAHGAMQAIVTVRPTAGPAAGPGVPPLGSMRKTFKVRL